MPISYLHYGLHSGYIHNWLVAGPMALPVAEAQGLRGVTLVDHVLQAHAMPDSGITSRPVERGSLEEGVFKVGDYQGAWSYYACLEDHWVDHSGRYPSLQYLRSWAYAQLVSKEPRQVSLALTAFGKADVWLNGEHLGQQETKDNLPHRQVYPARLNPGGNQLLVRFESLHLAITLMLWRCKFASLPGASSQRRSSLAARCAYACRPPFEGSSGAIFWKNFLRKLTLTAIFLAWMTRFLCAGPMTGKNQTTPTCA